MGPLDIFCGSCCEHLGTTQPEIGKELGSGRPGRGKNRPADDNRTCECGIRYMIWWTPDKTLWRLKTDNPMFVAVPRTDSLWGFGPDGRA